MFLHLARGQAGTFREQCRNVKFHFYNNSGLIVLSEWDQKGYDLLYTKADKEENLLPRVHQSSGKGQTFVCSGSKVSYLCRFHPAALCLCGGQVRLFIMMSQLSNLRPLEVYLGSKYQTGFGFGKE